MGAASSRPRRVWLVAAAVGWLALSATVWWFVVGWLRSLPPAHDPYGLAELERAFAEHCSEKTDRVLPALRVPPRYPAWAGATGIEGAVIVAFRVGVDGRVSGARVISAEPERVFDHAALSAVERWRFCPIEDGPDDGVEQKVRLTFELDRAAGD